MANEYRLGFTQRSNNPHDVGREMIDTIRFGIPILRGTPVTALIDGDSPIPCSRERGQLMPLRISKFREAMDQQNQWTPPLRHGMNTRAVDVEREFGGVA